MGAALEMPSFVDLLQSAPLLPAEAKSTLSQLERLSVQLVPQRPARGAPEDEATLSAFHALARQVVATAGAASLLLLRQAQGEQLRSLILSPDGDLSPAKTRAAAHVQTAFETLGDFVAFVERLVRGLPLEVFSAAAEAAQDDDVSELDDESRVHLRFFLGCVVAIEALRGGSDDDAAFWAVEVLHAASDLRALLSVALPLLDAHRARLRSRFAWASWDEADAELEATSWKHLK